MSFAGGSRHIGVLESAGLCGARCMGASTGFPYTRMD